MFANVTYHLFKNNWRKVWEEGFKAGAETQKSKTLAELKAADPSHPLYQWNNPAFRLGYEYAMGVIEEEAKCS